MKHYTTPNLKFIAIKDYDIIATSGDSVGIYVDEETDEVL